MRCGLLLEPQQQHISTLTHSRVFLFICWQDMNSTVIIFYSSVPEQSGRQPGRRTSRRTDLKSVFFMSNNIRRRPQRSAATSVITDSSDASAPFEKTRAFLFCFFARPHRIKGATALRKKQRRTSLQDFGSSTSHLSPVSSKPATQIMEPFNYAEGIS